jgi:penicillin-binding protein 1C
VKLFKKRHKDPNESNAPKEKWKFFRKLWRGVKRYKYIIAGVFVLLFIWYWNCLPEKLFNDPTSTVIRDKDGNILGARIATDGQWRFPHNDKVPYKFRKAIVQFEDRDFYDHMGFSMKAFGRAMKQNINSGSVVSGGSTITMQVARLSRKGKNRSIYEKFTEVFWATRIELKYTKKEILSMYASNAPMGGNVVGLDAAAWRYFGRTPNELSWAEAATLAVLPNAPGLMHPGRNRKALIAKRNRLLKRLFKVGEIDKITYDLATIEPLPDEPPDLPQIAPHLIDRIMSSNNEGKLVETTIDKALQEHVVKVLDLHHERLKQNEIYNAAALVLEVNTGNVLSYVGNTKNEEEEHGSMVDIIRAPRSTGSILKPYLYALMLDDGKLTPNMLIPDVPTHLTGYNPKNYSEKYDGAVPAHRALSRSLNIPSVRMLRTYGIQKFHHQLKKLGMTSLTFPPSHYGLSLILGGAEAKLWDLASIYASMGRTLNNYPDYDGTINQRPTYIQRDQKKTAKGESNVPVLNPASVWFTFEAMLQVSRPNEEVNWHVFDSSKKIAWKTGTSMGFKDAWAIGVTPGYVVAVWVGNGDGEGRKGLIGIEAAAPILFDIFDRLPSTGWFDPPYDEMAEIPICRLSGYRASELCEQVDTSLVPQTSLETIACPYEQVVHLDVTGKWQVDNSCEAVTEIKTESRFVLPPVMEWYYKSKHPNYKTLPPIRPDCRGTSDEWAMAIIYPKKPSRIYVPIELDGTLGKTVFEIMHRNKSTEVFWHLDEAFIGSTKDIHQMELNPDVGEHTLTLVDENGESLSQKFEIVGK